MWHVQGTGEVHRGFWRETPIKIYHVEDLGVDGRIILKRVFKKWNGGCLLQISYLLVLGLPSLTYTVTHFTTLNLPANKTLHF